jgi:oxygen-independent coproporphyrinogen-3 oxidase
MTAPAPRSAYVHIPFCHRRCFYCDFAVVPLGDKADAQGGPGSRSIETYLVQLLKEIALSPSGPPLATVYVGGGTPSLLSPEQIGRVLSALRARFGLQSGSEITLEMDPASFERMDLEALLRCGVNRVSLGGQSFDDQVLESLGRRHRRSDLLEACEWLHGAVEHGALRSWSLDLIRNLPDQSDEAWAVQLERAVAMRAPHLSIYDLSVEPGTVFSKLEQRGELELPDEDGAADRIAATSDRLVRAGYCRYEISNFARPGQASRHNRVYWSGAGWWAFGLGATSAPWGERFARPRTREAYGNWLEQQRRDGPHSSLLRELATPMSLEDRLLVGLRRREGVDLLQQAQSCGWSSDLCSCWLPQLEQRWAGFLQTDLMRRCGSRWQLTDPRGMAVSNAVLVELVEWWEELTAVADPQASCSKP